MSGILYGVSVGPGDGELLTIKAKNCIEKASFIAIPTKEIKGCKAFEIAKSGIPDLSEKKIICFPVPMTSDEEQLAKAYDEISEKIADILKSGKDVAFLNLGDISLYGTFWDVHERIESAGYQTEIIPGVTSVNAIAACLKQSLCKREEKLLIHPGMYDMDDLSDLFDFNRFEGTVAILKSSANLKKNKEKLEKLVCEGKIQIKAVSDCGMETQRIYESLDEIPDDAGYFTTLLIKTVKKEADRKTVFKNQKELRFGITTGTCAAAAAYAATVCLSTGKVLEEVSLITPSKEQVLVPVYFDEKKDGESASFYVIKDSGDDPDVTNGAKVFAKVSMSAVKLADANTEADVNAKKYFTCEEFPGLYLTGGEGIGIVTKEGLEQPVGYPAINKVPRQMIFEAVSGNLSNYIYALRDGVNASNIVIEISIPEGVTLAKKTFNPMLGIEGGISVLGTSGILEPMSEKAIVDTIETLIRQQSVLGKKQLLVTPGHYGQGYVSDYLKLPLDNSIKCSNFIGDTIDLAVSYGFKEMLLVGNLGKLVKLAAGIMNTHSKMADGRMDVLITHLALCGGTKDMAEKLFDCINTDTALSMLEEWNLKDEVVESVIKTIHKKVLHRSGEQLKVGVVLFSEKYGYLGETEYASEILSKMRE